MTDRWQPSVANLIAVLDGIDAVDRYAATIAVEKLLDDELRAVRQRTANELYSEGRTYREVGAIMGRVTAQRAEQIAKGRRMGTGVGHDSESTDPAS